MIRVRKVEPGDEERIIRLIYKYMKDVDIRKNIWERLFVNHWDLKDYNFGYVLVNNEEIFGFLGTIICERVINNKLEKFSNLTTFVVDEEFRKNSIALLYPLLRSKDYTVTAFTSSESADKIYDMAGFKILESRMKIIIPNQINSLRHNNISVILDNKTIENTIRDNELKIYNNHLKFKAVYILVKSSNDTCLIIGKKSKVKIKKIPFSVLHIHYIGNRNIFPKFINCISMKLCFQLKVLGLLVEERYLADMKINNFALPYVLPKPYTYKSDTLDSSSIDTLYSEFFLLNI